ncbi:feruloyl-CoA synthase [Spirosoma linguale]|uniref:AMP-dependent synthetase and ligase n=1 Tax=Spirosoma linguale (strain ATCC 33905 / DSM 74 / LMG 10896 / Claus 1) TaxID=504472 RepID=D2QP03_SPILD|nr:AMP-dependent synthetase and ligase [Spirosoma linguale DSM 74]
MSFKQIAFGPTKTHKTVHADGSIRLRLEHPLEDYPVKLTEKLIFWAQTKPNQTFLARRNAAGDWVEYSYGKTLAAVKSIAQFLLNQQLGPDDTLAILSENSLEHALLALAAIHVGIPFSPISPPYSLISRDLGRLQHCLECMTPKVVFAQDNQVYSRALLLAKSLFPDAVIITATEGGRNTSFADVLTTEPTEAVEQAFARVTADSVAKVLFTSGSTGLPKGVINTHRMWCANLQQITQVFPFMATEPPVLIDWLPWNHTFGGNHNVGLALYNGGTLYIDDGKPTPAGIETTVQNLREISPTVYFNVPKGFEMLIPYFEQEPELRKTFFARLNILFYAGATLGQPIWNRLEELAMETIGERIPIITGLGCTESGPSAMFANWGGSFSGLLGVPVAGMDVKLVPDGDKLEARYKAPNVTPGYWRNTEATQSAFDEEGYYKTGDAVRFHDEDDPDKGLVFDGRIAEDFKLSTGTWVNVGILKAKIISAGAPIVQDVVIAGLDRAYVGVLLFLNADACRRLANLSPELPNEEVFLHPTISDFVSALLIILNKTAKGTSDRIERALVALEPPSIDLGEITDKGSLNQRAILKHRAALIDQLYHQPNFHEK